MAYLVKASPRQQQRCVFSSCDHAPATFVYHHEFIGRAPKPMCTYHTNKSKQIFKLTVKGD